MRSVWFGTENSYPSTTVVNYIGITSSSATAWTATLNQRQCPIAEDVTIVRLRVFLDTAPGTGKRYTFAINDDGSASAASVVVEDGETEGEWVGSAAIASGSLISLMSTPSGTPTAGTNVYWVVEYDTAGAFFLMLGGNMNANISTSATNYDLPASCNGVAWGTTADSRAILIPSGGNMTKLYVATPPGSPASGKSYAFSARLNDTSDNLTATISNTAVNASATGTVAVAAGDRLVIKVVPTGTPTARRGSWCLKIEPTTADETFVGFGGVQSLAADNTTRYEQFQSHGFGTWNTTESNRYVKLLDYVIKKLYVGVVTAPASGKTRTFTIRDTGTDTALSAVVTGTATTGNDTSNSVTLTPPYVASSFQSLKQVGSGTPTASSGHRGGFVVVTPTPVAPGTAFDLRQWKLTVPYDSDNSGAADEISQASLPAYANHPYFELDASGRLCAVAPCQGSTTGGSGGTRSELRELESGGSESAWSMATASRILTVSGIFDPTSLTDRKEMIVGQIHATGGTPPIYLAVEHHVASPRLRLYKDGPGVDNLITGLTPTTEISYRIEVLGGWLRVYACLGGIAGLTNVQPAYSFHYSEFVEYTNCYYKAGAYNKSEAGDGGTGAAITRLTYLSLNQNAPAPQPSANRGGFFSMFG